MQCLSHPEKYKPWVTNLWQGAFYVSLFVTLSIPAIGMFKYILSYEARKKAYEKELQARGLIRYKNRVGTQEQVFEWKQLDKGLVKYGRFWMAPQDKDNLSKLAEIIKKEGQIRFKEVATNLEVTSDKIKELAHKLHAEEIIKGTFTSDGEGFTTEERLKKDLMKRFLR